MAQHGMDSADVRDRSERSVDWATEADDSETIAAGLRRVEAEIAAEDNQDPGPAGNISAPDGLGAIDETSRYNADREAAAEEMDEDSPQAMLDTLRGRVFGFLKNEPDVTELEEVGDGFYGFRLTAAGDVSMTIRFTSGNQLADGTSAP